MSAGLGWNRYGKMNVRLLRVVKDSPKHEVNEFTAQMLLEGPFDGAFENSDNSSIVPTETQKNTLYALSKKYSVEHIERWASSCAKDMLARHKHLTAVFVHVDKIPWQRINVDGKDHPHAFMTGTGGTRFATLRQTRSGITQFSAGFKDLKVMKTTMSGFEGFIRDEYTTLKETKDRIMATKVYCEWNYLPSIDVAGTDFNAIFAQIQKITLKNFAGDFVKGTYSASVQATIYNIGMEVLRTFPSIQDITLKLPNLHYYYVNFDDFKTDLKNNNEVFLTFDGAAGQIEATIERKGAKL